MLNGSQKERRLKVLILPSWYPPEGGWFFRDQAHFVSEAGADVAVAYARPIWRRQWMRDPLLALQRRGCEVVDDDGVLSLRRHWLSIPSRGRLEPWQTARVAQRLFADAVDMWGRPDVVHAHSTLWAGYAAYALQERWGVPYVITEHRGIFSLPPDKAAAYLRPWYRPYLQRALNNSRCLLLVGSGLAEELAPLVTSNVPCEVLPNGVDTEFFCPGDTRSAEPFTFAFVGNLLAAKGVYCLLDAFVVVHRATPDARLVLAGSGPERGALERAVLEAGLRQCVDFVGQVNAREVRAVLRRAHVFVLPSEFEGLPVSVIEAMATGLPVIATDGAPPELFPPYAGSRIPFGDSVALAGAMEQTMRDYASFDRGRIRDFAVERYDFRRVAKRLLEVYEQYGKRPPVDSSAAAPVVRKTSV